MKLTPLLGIVISPMCLWCAQIYNYEAYGNTVDGPLGTPSGTCTAESYVSEILSLSNCSSAPGIVTSARSYSTFTFLKAESTTSLTNATISSPFAASGYARLEDVLVVGAGDVSSVSMTMHLTGNATNNGLTLARMVLTFGFDYEARIGSEVMCAVDVVSGTKSFDAECRTSAHSIAMFQQHPYWFSLSAQMRQNPSGSPVSGSATVDFFSTATLESVAAYDSGGQFLADAVISSQGNNGTPFLIAESPEPRAAELVGAGVFLLATLRYMRAGQSRPRGSVAVRC